MAMSYLMLIEREPHPRTLSHDQTSITILGHPATNPCQMIAPFSVTILKSSLHIRRDVREKSQQQFALVALLTNSGDSRKIIQK